MLHHSCDKDGIQSTYLSKIILTLPHLPKTTPPSSPVKDGAHPSTVSAVAVYVQASGKEDPIFHSYGTVGEGGNKQLVPAWGREGEKHMVTPLLL